MARVSRYQPYQYQYPVQQQYRRGVGGSQYAYRGGGALSYPPLSSMVRTHMREFHKTTTAKLKHQKDDLETSRKVLRELSYLQSLSNAVKINPAPPQMKWPPISPAELDDIIKELDGKDPAAIKTRLMNERPFIDKALYFKDSKGTETKTSIRMLLEAQGPNAVNVTLENIKKLLTAYAKSDNPDQYDPNLALATADSNNKLQIKFTPGLKLSADDVYDALFKGKTESQVFQILWTQSPFKDREMTIFWNGKEEKITIGDLLTDFTRRFGGGYYVLTTQANFKNLIKSFVLAEDKWNDNLKLDMHHGVKLNIKFTPPGFHGGVIDTNNTNNPASNREELVQFVGYKSRMEKNLDGLSLDEIKRKILAGTLGDKMINVNGTNLKLRDLINHGVGGKKFDFTQKNIANVLTSMATPSTVPRNITLEGTTVPMYFDPGQGNDPAQNDRLVAQFVGELANMHLFPEGGADAELAKKLKNVFEHLSLYRSKIPSDSDLAKKLDGVLNNLSNHFNMKYPGTNDSLLDKDIFNLWMLDNKHMGISVSNPRGVGEAVIPPRRDLNGELIKGTRQQDMTDATTTANMEKDDQTAIVKETLHKNEELMKMWIAVIKAVTKIVEGSAQAIK